MFRDCLCVGAGCLRASKMNETDVQHNRRKNGTLRNYRTAS